MFQEQFARLRAAYPGTSYICLLDGGSGELMCVWGSLLGDWVGVRHLQGGQWLTLPVAGAVRSPRSRRSTRTSSRARS